MLLSVSVTLLIALALDWLFGEPQRYHPLSGYGWLATQTERYLYNAHSRPVAAVLRGMAACMLLLLPFILLSTFCITSAWHSNSTWLIDLFNLLILTFCLGHRSLYDHVMPIVKALKDGDEQQARALTARIVSRDAQTLNIRQAATESVLENGNDALFAVLFWFAIAGAPGALFYRLVNTLDALWGYRNKRYLYFGRFAARLDDLMNYFPARLTAISYACLGHFSQAISCWREQTQQWDSPNAGPVIASGAGALGVKLGGTARYQGVCHARPDLGCGHAPHVEDIVRALKLVTRATVLWLLLITLIVWLFHA